MSIKQSIVQSITQPTDVPLVHQVGIKDVFRYHLEKPYLAGGLSNQHIDLTSAIVLASDFTITFKTILTDVTSRGTWLGLSSSAATNFYFEAGTPRYRRGGGIYDFSTISLAVNTEYSVTIARAGSLITYTIVDGNGVTQQETKDETTPLSISIDRIGEASLYEIAGLMWDININSVAAYTGATNNAAGWVDTIGSNDGTINASPSTVKDVDALYNYTV